MFWKLWFPKYVCFFLLSSEKLPWIQQHLLLLLHLFCYYLRISHTKVWLIYKTHKTVSSLFWPCKAGSEGTTLAANDAKSTGWTVQWTDTLQASLQATYTSKLCVLPSIHKITEFWQNTMLGTKRTQQNNKMHGNYFASICACSSFEWL